MALFSFRSNKTGVWPGKPRSSTSPTSIPPLAHGRRSRRPALRRRAPPCGPPGPHRSRAPAPSRGVFSEHSGGAVAGPGYGDGVDTAAAWAARPGNSARPWRRAAAARARPRRLSGRRRPRPSGRVCWAWTSMASVTRRTDQSWEQPSHPGPASSAPQRRHQDDACCAGLEVYMIKMMLLRVDFWEL